MSTKTTDQKYTITSFSSLLAAANSLLSLRQKLLMLAFGMASIQFLMRLWRLGEYGFHQDELLYLALSDHLAWGYREVPPAIAVIGKISKLLLGDTVAAARLIPSISAFLIVYITGLLTIRLGGKFFAVAIACSCVAFSPAFLATGSLFIPQVFDELCWLMSAYLLVAYFQDKKTNYLIYLGILAGIAILVKYTFIIYLGSLFIGIGLHRSQRLIFTKKFFWIGILLTILLITPHLFWQYQHHFPALHHYNELKKTQLDYLTRTDFIVQLLVVNAAGLLIWLAAIKLIPIKKYSKYRFLGVAALLSIVLMMILNGKSYYIFGCFLPLFALGSVWLENRLNKISLPYKTVLYLVLSLPGLLSAIIVLPYLSIEKSSQVMEWTHQQLGLDYPLKWEDQKIHNVNQNYADMIGWDELAIKTSQLYQAMPLAAREKTIVFAEKYGEAGAIDQYQQTYPLPKVISFCSSYALWAPPTLHAKNIIYIADAPPPKFSRAIKIDSIQNPFSRVKGLQIYLIKDVNEPTKNWYTTRWRANRQTEQSLAALLAMPRLF